MNGSGLPAHLQNYTHAADVAVMTVCFVMFVLMTFSYIRRTRSYRLFCVIVPTLVVACAADIFFNVFTRKQGLGYLAMGFFWLYHAALLTVFCLFTVYISEVTSLDARHRRGIYAFSIGFLLLAAALDAGFCFFGPESDGSRVESVIISNRIFMGGYLVYAVADAVLFRLVHRRLYKRVMMGFYGSVFISYLVIIVQNICSRSSFTCLSFLFPVIAMFYIMHANPYDVELGTVAGNAMQDVVRYYYEKKKPFLYVSLYLPSFDSESAEFPAALRALIRDVAARSFRGSILFHAGRGHAIMLVPRRRNPDFEHRIGKVIKSVEDQHRIFHYDYKVVVGESVDDISRKNEYLPLIYSVHRVMPENTVHRVTPDDLKNHDRSVYILQQLEDIYKTRDLDDRRVLVYCQPVFNLRTGQYDTAEALMRLNLDELGLVLPDQFIYLAEEYGYIHVLTEIILHKTCEEICRLNAAGYSVSRISVNVSMLELKDDNFCEDITGIIARSGLSGDRLAIELTESQTESDFHVMKAKIEELKEKGIKFYLDDFGTGYSNMERIMELPFDIIKFDRSMVLSSSASDRSEKIVADLAGLFSRLDYAVLYEGVETDRDESMCRDMSASYLQGFKYSRPIPISELRNYAPRAENRAG